MQNTSGDCCVRSAFIRLRRGSIGNGEIESIGAALVGCEAAAEESEREVLVPTAKDRA